MAVSTQSLGFAAGTNIFTDTANANAAIVVKAASTVVHLVTIDNTANGAASYVKLYNNAGAVTVGTTVPDEVILVPSSTSITVAIPGGKTFSTGLQVATVTAGGTGGTTSPTSAVIVRIVYV